MGSPCTISLVLIVSKGKDIMVAKHPDPKPAEKLTPDCTEFSAGDFSKAYVVIPSNKPNCTKPKVAERACAATCPFQRAVHPSLLTICCSP